MQSVHNYGLAALKSQCSVRITMPVHDVIVSGKGQLLRPAPARYYSSPHKFHSATLSLAPLHPGAPASS
jgi:hypothetical protein